MKQSKLYQLLRWRYLELRTYCAGLINLFRKTPPTFIIFAQGRTGSTLLVDLLRNSLQIFVDGEVFGSSMPINVLFKRFYLNALAKSKTKGKAYYGYRIKIYELYQIQGFNPEKAIAFVRAEIGKGAKVIYLERSNKFRQVISSLVAESRDQYHDKGSVIQSKVEIDISVIPNRVKHLQYFSEQEAEVLRGFDYVSVNYEEDLLKPENHQKVIDRITAYLGIDSFKPNTHYTRTSSDNFVDFIKNHEEVAQLAHDLGYN